MATWPRGRRKGSIAPPLIAPLGLSDHAYNELRRRIFDRQVVAGGQLKIDDLAQELGMSAIPIREALVRLVAERIVVGERYKGFKVAPSLDADEIHELADARQLIELHAARLLAPKVTDRQLHEMKHLAGQMERFATNSDYAAFRMFDSRDNDFHELIVQKAGNSFLSQAYGVVSSRVRLTRLFYADGPTDVDAILSEHAAIIAAFQDADPDHVCATLQVHLTNAHQRLLSMSRRFEASR